MTVQAVPRSRLWRGSRSLGVVLASAALLMAAAGTPADVRDTYLKAINSSLDACLPLKFTGGLGGSLAGRPIAIRYVDNRELKQ